MGANMCTTNKIRKILIGEYSDRLFDIFESSEDIGFLFLKNVGLVVARTPEDYELIQEIKDLLKTDKFFFLFFLQDTPIIVCDDLSNLEFAKKQMKKFNINYLLSLKDNTLYFYGVLLNNRFVNNLRKKLKMEVLRLNEVQD